MIDKDGSITDFKYALKDSVHPAQRVFYHGCVTGRFYSGTKEMKEVTEDQMIEKICHSILEKEWSKRKYIRCQFCKTNIVFGHTDNCVVNTAREMLKIVMQRRN